MNFKTFFYRFESFEILKNTSVLISGTALAQLIPVLLQPVLRRYYPAEVFGAYSVYLSLVGILAIIASFKYELAIILPKSDKESINVFFLSSIINFSFCIVLFLGILLFKKHLLKFLNLSDEYSYYLYFVPLGIFFYNLYQCINNWLTRQKKFFALSVNKFVRRGGEGLFQVIFKYLKIPQGIILGDIIGHISNLISGFYQAAKSGFSISNFSISKIKYVLTKYSDYPKFNVIPSFMSACSFLLPAIILNKFYSSEYVGYFDLSKLLLSIPLALVSTSLTSVLLQSLNEKYKMKKSLIKELFLVFGIVISICILEILVIELVGVGLFKIIFGDAWGFSGEISKILVWSYAFNFLVTSFSAIFISLNKIKMLSIWQIIYFILILSLFFFRTLGFMDFLKLYVLIELVCYFINAGMMLSIVLSYEREIKFVK